MNLEKIEYEGGIKFWYKNEKLHREDSPAVEWPSGRKDWYLNGKRHRLNGPAIEYVNGLKEWWIEGKQLTEEEFNEHPLVKKKVKLNKIKEKLEDCFKNFKHVEMGHLNQLLPFFRSKQEKEFELVVRYENEEVGVIRDLDFIIIKLKNTENPEFEFIIKAHNKDVLSIL